MLIVYAGGLMKKVFKRIGIVMIIILVLWVSLHHILKVTSLKKERENQSFIEVNGLNMHYEKVGHGEENIVLLNGFGTPYPSLDFKALLVELEKNHTVYVIEPFGYGTSDLTDEKRSVANITKELHEAIVKLGLNDYYLMGHSISGLYSAFYMEQYPNEIKGFIGIDSSVSTQDLPEDMGSSFIFKTIDFLGVYRLATLLSSSVLPESYHDFLSENEINRIKTMTASRMNNKTILSEMNEMINNFETVRKIPVNEDIPVLIFLSDESIESDERWLEFHDDYYQKSKFYERKILEGTHYLHHQQAQAIATYVNDFIHRVKTLE